MLSAQALIQRNVHRARHSLPFFDPDLRDLIAVIPALFSEGRQSIGIHGRPGCNLREHDLLRKYLAKKPDIVIGRLPDRVLIESLIALFRPSLAGRYFTSIMAVCMARGRDYEEEIRAKIGAVRDVFQKNGTPFSGIVYSGRLPQPLVYEIIRTGIVLGGRHPVTSRDAASQACVHIGDLPGTITEVSHTPYNQEWNPFSHYLEGQTTEFIREKNYPSALSIPSASPFIIPYLHILHHYEECMDKEHIEKMRVSLIGLFSLFPPTVQTMQDLGKVWKMGPSCAAFQELGFAESLRLRKWLVPLEEDEIPVCAWPPPERFALDRLSIRLKDHLWEIPEARDFRHTHPWVVLAWAALAGLVGPSTRIDAPRDLLVKHTARNILLDSVSALLGGADMLVPEDHLQGSIRCKNGRFFFSPRLFAVLEQGNKHSIGLFETVKKKALLDDIDLKDGAGLREKD